MRRLLIGPLVSLGLLAACATAEAPEIEFAAAPPAEDAMPAEDTCGAANFRHLIGAPASAIDRASLPPRTRVIGPDDAVTMDYRPDRLNIHYNEAGVVTQLRCV